MKKKKLHKVYVHDSVALWLKVLLFVSEKRIQNRTANLHVRPNSNKNIAIIEKGYRARIDRFKIGNEIIE